MREDDPAVVGARLPFLVPAFDQDGTRPLALVGGMDHAASLIGADCFAGSACGEVPGRILLPRGKLAANLADLDPAVALVDRPERRASLDGLKLLLVANQHNLGSGLRGMGQHALHLARADHARFVDDEHVIGSQILAPLVPSVLKAGDGARSNA